MKYGFPTTAVLAPAIFAIARKMWRFNHRFWMSACPAFKRTTAHSCRAGV